MAFKDETTACCTENERHDDPGLLPVAVATVVVNAVNADVVVGAVVGTLRVRREAIIVYRILFANDFSLVLFSFLVHLC